MMTSNLTIRWTQVICAWLALSGGLAACTTGSGVESQSSSQAAVGTDPDDPNEPVIPAAVCGTPQLALDAGTDLFTIDGQQTFLQCVSYFGALALTDDEMGDDLRELKSHGFNCVRVWPSWGYRDSPSSYRTKAVIRPDGDIPGTNVSDDAVGRLTRLLTIAAQHNFVVDVTFTRDTVRQRGCLSFAHYKAAILDVTDALLPYRNAFFDLQNETNHWDNQDDCDSTALFPFCPGDGDDSANPATRTCQIAYLKPAQWTNLSGAVHDADPNRLVTISGADSGFQPAPDATMVHCCRGPSWPGGITAAIDAAEALFPHHAVHAQEPNRCHRPEDTQNNLIDCNASTEKQVSTNTFLKAAGLAVSAGAGGFTLHTGASFDLTHERLNLRLNQAEAIARDNLGSKLPPLGAVPAKPVLISPAGGAVVGLRPVLKWKPGAAYPPINQYKVLIQRHLPDGTFETADSAFTCDTHYNVPAGKLMVGQSYRWSIRAQNELGWGTNAQRNFTVQ